jgi:hypothetical protein
MKRNYTNLLLANVLVLSSSCATFTEEQKYEREDRFVQAVDQFRLKKIACQNSGGATVMRMRLTSRIPSYTRHDYESTKCVRRGLR